MANVLPVFHIGANKAGSTTLQRALFSRHPDVFSLGKPDPAPKISVVIAQMVSACDHRDTAACSFDSDAARRAWDEVLSENLDVGRVPVFSREELIRYYLYGEPDPHRLPKAVVEMAGPVRVVIVTRNQLKLIESLYIHKANSSNFLSPEQWFASEPEWHAFGYQFHAVADAWAGVVGEKNIGVFLFEELAQDSDAFARRLCDFVGINADLGVKLLQRRHENVRKSKRTQAYARLRSAMLPGVSLGKLLPESVRRRWHDYLEKGELARVELPKDWCCRIEERHRHDNQMLAKRFGLPLEDYGYPL
jgi:Sulfotransferase domain